MRLGINTGFAVNRFPMPEQWLKVIGANLKLKHVQLTADIINPSWGDKIVNDLVDRINLAKKKYRISIDSVMTGAFTRVNHFSHPNYEIREYWLDWFKKLADIAVKVGAYDLSSHFGILCVDDYKDSRRRKAILKENIDLWRRLAGYGKQIGLKSLSWEPMSVSREYGETISETKRLQKLLKNAAIPINLCLDVDHGNISSKNPRDSDYKAWLSEFAKYSPFIHIKQSSSDKSGHHPFTMEYNESGAIRPAEMVRILKKQRGNNTLLFELSFREREPTDSLVLAQLKESVHYWRKYLKHDNN